MVAPLVVPLAVVVAAGGATAVKGLADIVKSRSVAGDAGVQHEAALIDLEAAQRPVHERVAAYGGEFKG